MGKSIKIDNHNAITAPDFASMLRMQLRALWEGTCPADKLPPLMVWGAPGLGKSSIIRELADRKSVV